jgi:hypothetical protein
MKSKLSLAAAAVSLVALALFVAHAHGAGSTATVTVSGTQMGVSTCYIGATEGNVNFNINDFTDLGINTYRIYGGMQRWEATDDDGVFGSPTIAQIKADPNVIPWSVWDNAINNPPNGSDYWWSGTTGLWQGSAATMLSALHNAGIRVVMTLRNVDNNGNPAWAAQLNPPNTTAGQNEWWEHVFATVYELDVRNNYGIDDWEIHNEPDNSGQGWGGTLADYESFATLTADAIRYVYATYLPGRTPHIYAPVTTGGSSWPDSVMKAVPGAFDSVDVHDYNSDITGYVTTVHGYMNADGFGSAPLWLSEWGTYRGGYDQASKGVSLVIDNLIRMSEPATYVYGSHLFTLYDWQGFSGGFQNFQGLINGSGTRLSSYYALRIATRALVGCKPTYQSTSNQGNLTAITTKDASGAYYVLITNNASKTTYTTTVDLSSLKTTATGTEWQYDATHNDVVVGSPSLSAGKVTVSVPGTSAILLKF